MFSGALSAQEVGIEEFVKAEKRINQLAEELSEVRFNDKLLDSINQQLLDAFTKTLNQEGSFDYSFDSLKYLGHLTSNDKLVRVFTWHNERANGTHHHFGFIQYYLKAKKEVLLYPLTDYSDSIVNPEEQSVSNEEWFGATYYELIENKTKTYTYYTLLGWDGNNLYTNKKVIDVLYFNASGKPRFGKSLFKAGRTKTKRVIFEYAKMTTMLLHYDSHLNLIVFDHLAPTSPLYQGNPMFYGPDLSYDAFEFKDELWEYIPTIDYKREKVFTLEFNQL